MGNPLTVNHLLGLQWALDENVITDLVARKQIENVIFAVKAVEALNFCGDSRVHNCGRPHCPTSDSFIADAPEPNIPDYLRMRCQVCNTSRPVNPHVKCWKCGAPLMRAHDAWEEPAMPDVGLVRKSAVKVGYSIAVHGSLERDLDLVAAPWVESAVSAEDLIIHLIRDLNLYQAGPYEQKPHGRVAVTLQLYGWFKPIDLSICPRVPLSSESSL